MIRPAEFKVSVEFAADTAKITVAGEIDIATVGQLAEARDGALAHDPATVLIDLGSVTFLDSSGLKFLLETQQLAHELGWTLELLRPDASAMSVLTLTGADQRLPFVDSDPE